MSTFTTYYLDELVAIRAAIDEQSIERCVELLAETKAVQGRVFVLGVGGSAANATHAVNDLRKIVGIEAYAPTDNIAELTARTNDDGWPTIFDTWLQTSHLTSKDLILVLSVSGGDLRSTISTNIMYGLTYAGSVGAKIIGIVGRSDGFTAKVADACVIVPTINPSHVTQHAENFQSIIWHLWIIHPLLTQ